LSTNNTNNTNEGATALSLLVAPRSGAFVSFVLFVDSLLFLLAAHRRRPLRRPPGDGSPLPGDENREDHRLNAPARF
jgi:hypothetical protein